VIRRDLLKLLGLSFVPLPGLAMEAPTPGRITLSHQGVALFEAPIAYRANSAMLIRVQGLGSALTFDSCELYRPGDDEPYRSCIFPPIVMTPVHTLDLAWKVSSEAPAFAI
jgi:hypothetical protein